MDRGARRATVHRVAKSQTRMSTPTRIMQWLSNHDLGSLHQLPRAATAKHQNPGGLEQQSCIVSQFCRLDESQVRVPLVPAPSEGWEGEPLPCFSPTFLCGWQSLGLPGLRLPHPYLCLPLHMVFSVYVCLSLFLCPISPFFIRTPVKLDWSPP